MRLSYLLNIFRILKVYFSYLFRPSRQETDLKYIQSFSSYIILTLSFFIVKAKKVMLFGETIAVYCRTCEARKYTVCGKSPLVINTFSTYFEGLNILSCADKTIDECRSCIVMEDLRF